MIHPTKNNPMRSHYKLLVVTIMLSLLAACGNTDQTALPALPTDTSWRFGRRR